jgi:Family of unknown function (DUF6962)
MKEPDVTITDYLLALEAFAFAVLIARAATATPLQRWFVLFFAATAAASLVGGTVHGFFNDSVVLWRLVLVSLGIVSAAAWAIGARLLFTDRVAQIITVSAWVAFVVYVLVVAFVTDSFSVAIANYLPSTLFLIVAFFVSYHASPAAPLRLGLGGLLLTLVAAGVQQARIALHPTYFNHNALYHLLQAIALFLIFRAAMFLTIATP